MKEGANAAALRLNEGLEGRDVVVAAVLEVMVVVEGAFEAVEEEDGAGAEAVIVGADAGWDAGAGAET